MTTYILGAGPAGLAIALGLTETGKGPFVMLEAQAQPGGMAQTLNWAPHGRHDLGPHKLYTADSALMNRVLNLLPQDQWLQHTKTSRIYLGGQFLSYPPSITELLRLFGMGRTAKMGWEYLRAPGGPGTNFEEDLIRRVGPTLYGSIFRPMAWKIWGNPTERDGQLARDRVQLPTLGDWIRQRTGRGQKNAFEAPTFHYPCGGLQSLWTAMEKRFHRGGHTRYAHRVIRLDGDHRRVTAIVAQHPHGTVRFDIGKNDFVFSTLPLRDLGALFPGLGSALAEDLHGATPAHDLLLVFLKIKGLPGHRLMKEGWVFVPDPTIPFHRVSETGAFDPSLVNHGSILCCEIMAAPHRTDRALSDHDHATRAVDGLRRMGYSFTVEDSRVIRLPSSYPVPTEASHERRRKALATLDESDNWKVVGRSGAFQYIGTLDALDIGFGAARWLSTGALLPAWEQERRRTLRYPIYD